MCNTGGQDMQYHDLHLQYQPRCAVPVTSTLAVSIDHVHNANESHMHYWLECAEPEYIHLQYHAAHMHYWLECAVPEYMSA